MNFGFQLDSTSHFGTRTLPALTFCSSALPSTSFPNLQTCKPSNLQAAASVSPFPATLTDRVKCKSFVCHSCKKHPGWGTLLLTSYPMRIALPLARGVVEGRDHRGRNLSGQLFMRHGSRDTDHRTPVTSHQSRVTKSRGIRTCTKRARNSRRIRTSKTHDLKPFRIRTYEKTPRGVPLALSLPPFPPSAIIIGLASPPGSATFWPVRTFRSHDAF